jgi:holliday junction resolvase YEN1
MKQLLKLFGFPFIVARGEAEAEAALLQREGIVDAVFSEDVDTLMFGCGLTMRNWSSEGSRGNKTPTHVTIYDASKIAAGPSGLDREGMVLVALMSGGDYIPEGVPGCGIKVACEAARAGFGKSLLSIPKTDTVGFRTWRDSLAHELRTNASKFFRVKHNALQLPEAFPNQEVLGYYAQPMVSSAERIQKLRNEIQWDGLIDIAGLRAFVADAFEWRYRPGAVKFIKGS